MIDAVAPLVAAPSTAAPLARPAPASGDFATAMAEAARDLAGTLRRSEAMAMAGLQEQVPMQRVVEAVMAAETKLQAALAVRDKAVAAWQEISRMPI